MKKQIGLKKWVMLLVLGFVCIAQADAISEAKARRMTRRNAVEQLVQSGLAEEGDAGYLVAKGSLDAKQTATVQAENQDRRIAYEAIAKAHGQSVEAIGKKAAKIQQSRR